jgi:fumarate hydratase class II
MHIATVIEFNDRLIPAVSTLKDTMAGTVASFRARLLGSLYTA